MSNPVFSFGTPASDAATSQATASATTSAPASGGLFGSATSTPGLAFGSSNAGGANVQPAGGLFGNLASSTGVSSTPLFGNKSSTAASTGSTLGMFGQSGSGSGLFGNAAKSTPSGDSSLFGNSTGASATPTPNLFGATPTAPTNLGLFNSAETTQAPSSDASTAPPLFTSASPSPFGTASSNITFGTTQTPAKPLFGMSSTTPAGAPPTDAAKPSTSGLFGSANTKPGSTDSQPATSTPLFGQAAKPSPLAGTPASQLAAGSVTPATGGVQPNAGSVFNTQGQASGMGLFGQKPDTTSSTGQSLFGASSAPSSQPAPAATGTATSLFGAKTGAATSGALAPDAAGSTPSGLFGSATASKPTNHLFGGLASTTKPEAPPTTTPASSSLLFGNKSTSSAPGTAPTTTPGLVGAATTTATSGTPLVPSTTSGGLAGTTSAGTSSLLPASKSAETALTAPASILQNGPAAPPSLAASTVGPPSQLPRLKNKTMDEIITRWATDLSKYQKEFKEQASKVAEWDRLLVANGEKIQKLYLGTYEAERASNEIERQLAAVESQQDELAAWLDRYEGEVDDLVAKRVGETKEAAGPDQERERTYKLAEKLIDRLDEMGKDLSKMIKEINDLSGTLSKGSKTDDPLSQIVRVLNGHLSQLQWIDTNAAALQAKVTAAQKANNSMSSQYGNLDGDAAESFYRSYIGRR